MNWKGKDRRAVFILGAGATRGALRHVVFHKKRLKPPLNSDFFKIADTFVRATSKRSDSAALKRLRNVFKRELPVHGVPNMEEAFSLLYLSKDFPEIYRPKWGRERVAGTRREIHDFLHLVIGPLNTIARYSNETLYENLVAALGSSDTIITLNYDTILDSALVNARWNPKDGYGIKGGPSKVAWKVPKSEIDPRLKGVKLLKLHGSLNWFARGSYDNLNRVFDSKPVRVTAPRFNELRGYIRQIVPPVYGKFFAHPHWRHLWTQAYKSLLLCDLLVVIGCSLAETDFHLRALLGNLAAVRKLQNNPILHGILVDKAAIRRKWQRALGTSLRHVSSYKTFALFKKATKL